MKFAAIALRNLTRHRRRTLLSLLVIAAGAVALVLTAGFIRFSFDGLREALIRGGLGHLEVTSADLAAQSSLERSMQPAVADWEPLRQEIERLPHVLAAGGAIQMTGIVSRDQRSAAFMSVAVEPARERGMNMEVKLRAGANLKDEAPPEGEDTALLGLGLGRTLQADVGDTVTVLAMTGDGTLNAVDLKVSGLVTTGLQELDARILKVHLATAQRLLGTSNVTSVVVGLDDTAQTDAVKAAVERLLSARRPPLGVVDWNARAPFYGQVRALYAGIFWFLGIIVFVLVCLSNSNTLLMSVMERVREIGTLRAIGTSPAQVASIVVLEALWLGLLGGLIGDACAYVLVRVVNALDIQMPPPPGAASAIDLKLAVVPGDFLVVIVLMLAVLGVAAIFPAWRSVRLRIVDALGHV